MCKFGVSDYIAVLVYCWNFTIYLNWIVAGGKSFFLSPSTSRSKSKPREVTGRKQKFNFKKIRSSVTLQTSQTVKAYFLRPVKSFPVNKISLNLWCLYQQIYWMIWLISLKHSRYSTIFIFKTFDIVTNFDKLFEDDKLRQRHRSCSRSEKIFDRTDKNIFTPTSSSFPSPLPVSSCQTPCGSSYRVVERSCPKTFLEKLKPY